jgi:hypothetical protein
MVRADVLVVWQPGYITLSDRDLREPNPYNGVTFTAAALILMAEAIGNTCYESDWMLQRIQSESKY